MNKKGVVLWIAFLLLQRCVMAAPYVINAAGVRIDGISIESDDEGTIRLTTTGGQQMTFPPGAYRQAVAARPAQMDRIEQLVRERDLDGAADLLREVIASSRFLGWDTHASRMLARVELARGQFETALAEYETLFASHPTLRENLAERSRYMQSLLGAGHTERVVEMIDADIASGSREAAARAQIVRGDLKTANGLHREALLDYLRTALLFTDQLAALPEATYKTAITLQRLNDPRADEWFRQVLERFPNSEYADQIRKETMQ